MLDSPSLTLSVADRELGSMGEKRTLIVHDCPGASGAAQSPE
jgi:hypothetical protein